MQAKKAIKTIMLMMRMFLIHVSLHWSECGDDYLVFQSFIINHVAWLYWVLNGVTFLMSLELQ